MSNLLGYVAMMPVAADSVNNDGYPPGYVSSNYRYFAVYDSIPSIDEVDLKYAISTAELFQLGLGYYAVSKYGNPVNLIGVGPISSSTLLMSIKRSDGVTGGNSWGTDYAVIVYQSKSKGLLFAPTNYNTTYPKGLSVVNIDDVVFVTSIAQPTEFYVSSPSLPLYISRSESINLEFSLKYSDGSVSKSIF